MTALPLQLVRKTFALWWKHWPPLVLLVLVGYVLKAG